MRSSDRQDASVNGTLRALHVTGVYPSEEDPQTGVFIKAQVESLRERGLDVDVCVLKGRGLLKYLGGIREIRRFVANNRYDLVHAHYMYAGWSAWLATRLPLVVSFMGNDVFGDTDGEGRHRLSSTLAHGALSNVLAILSAHSVVKSRALGERLLSRKKSLVPNGVDLDLFSPRPIDRRRLGLPEDCFMILFAGRTSDPVKRYWLARQAVERTHLPSEQVRLIALEACSQSQVAEMMNAVDCLLLTSSHEGSPNVVKEALACNLPVVSVDVGDVRERIGDVEGCRIVEADPESLARGLLSVRERGRRLERGRARVRELTTAWAAERLADIYARIVPRHDG
jgi:glycosyltransferase involved in cell wall biosynthesis